MQEFLTRFFCFDGIADFKPLHQKALVSSISFHVQLADRIFSLTAVEKPVIIKPNHNTPKNKKSTFWKRLVQRAAAAGMRSSRKREWTCEGKLNADGSLSVGATGLTVISNESAPDSGEFRWHRRVCFCPNVWDRSFF